MNWSPVRPLPILRRNALAWSNQWLVLASGAFEAVFYLLGIGFGLGELVGDLELEGQVVEYPTFVAAGLMASSAMNGAIFDTTFNFYEKLRESKVYEGVLYSPLGLFDIVGGELAWSVGRGGAYGVFFLLVSLAFGAVASWWAVLMVPAALLIAAMFAGLGMWGTTFARSWADFDLLGLALLPLVMGSTTFFPLAVYPDWLQPFVQATPLYNGVALMRDLNTGLVGWHDVGHVVYLVVAAVGAMVLAGRRLERALLT